MPGAAYFFRMSFWIVPGRSILHVIEVLDAHADLADLAFGEVVVRVLADLRGAYRTRHESPVGTRDEHVDRALD